MFMQLKTWILLIVFSVSFQVHFGASKDALTRHFNKFGAVLKTHIVTDGVTGQSTGYGF